MIELDYRAPCTQDCPDMELELIDERVDLSNFNGGWFKCGGFKVRCIHQNICEKYYEQKRKELGC